MSVKHYSNGEWKIVPGTTSPGILPKISIKDGLWYGNGDYIRDEYGYVVSAIGEEGITPQFKIEEDYWFVSYNDGASWQQLGKAVGKDVDPVEIVRLENVINDIQHQWYGQHYIGFAPNGELFKRYFEGDVVAEGCTNIYDYSTKGLCVFTGAPKLCNIYKDLENGWIVSDEMYFDAILILYIEADTHKYIAFGINDSNIVRRYEMDTFIQNEFGDWGTPQTFVWKEIGQSDIEDRLQVLENIDHKAYISADEHLESRLTDTIDTKVADSSDAIKTYADKQITDAIDKLDAPNTYEAKGEAAKAEAAAKSYTDNAVSDLKSELSDNIANGVDDAKVHAESKASAAETSAKGYADGIAAQALTDAKSDVNTKLADYTNTAGMTEAIRAAKEAAIADAASKVSAAKEECLTADSKIQATLNSIESILENDKVDIGHLEEKYYDSETVDSMIQTVEVNNSHTRLLIDNLTLSVNNIYPGEDTNTINVVAGHTNILKDEEWNGDLTITFDAYEGGSSFRGDNPYAILITRGDIGYLTFPSNCFIPQNADSIRGFESDKLVWCIFYISSIDKYFINVGVYTQTSYEGY